MQPKFIVIAFISLFAILFSSCNSDNGEIIQINCSDISTNAILTQGVQVANILVNVSYTSNGDGSYNSQTIQSAGVIGLMATLQAGTFVDGNGAFSYSISGTPQSSGIASFAIAINGQSCSLNFQVMSVTSNNASSSCGATNVHNPNKNYGTMTDQEGNVYKTIVIGTQEWMAENLKTSIYRNGEPIAIANVSDSIQWGNLSTGAWCYYNNDSQYECPFGKLYNWYSVADIRHVCPTGWHEPTHDEWTELNDFLGGGSFAGGKMKTTGTQYWNSPNADATNESGFSGLPGGIRYGLFDFYGEVGYWWSSTEKETNPNDAYDRQLNNINGNLNWTYDDERYFFSVRCLRD